MFVSSVILIVNFTIGVQRPVSYVWLTHAHTYTNFVYVYPMVDTPTRNGCQIAITLLCSPHCSFQTPTVATAITDRHKLETSQMSSIGENEIKLGGLHLQHTPPSSPKASKFPLSTKSCKPRRSSHEPSGVAKLRKMPTIAGIMEQLEKDQVPDTFFLSAPNSSLSRNRIPGGRSSFLQRRHVRDCSYMDSIDLGYIESDLRANSVQFDAIRSCARQVPALPLQAESKFDVLDDNFPDKFVPIMCFDSPASSVKRNDEASPIPVIVSRPRRSTPMIPTVLSLQQDRPTKRSKQSLP